MVASTWAVGGSGLAPGCAWCRRAPISQTLGGKQIERFYFKLVAFTHMKKHILQHDLYMVYISYKRNKSFMKASLFILPTCRELELNLEQLVKERKMRGRPSSGLWCAGEEHPILF